MGFLDGLFKNISGNRSPLWNTLNAEQRQQHLGEILSAIAEWRPIPESLLKLLPQAYLHDLQELTEQLKAEGLAEPFSSTSARMKRLQYLIEQRRLLGEQDQAPWNAMGAEEKHQLMEIIITAIAEWRPIPESLLKPLPQVALKSFHAMIEQLKAEGLAEPHGSTSDRVARITSIIKQGKLRME